MARLQRGDAARKLDMTLELDDVWPSRYPAPGVPLGRIPLVPEHSSPQHLAVLHLLEHDATPLLPLLLAPATHDGPRNRATMSG
jgi:hypothetical protein